MPGKINPVSCINLSFHIFQETEKLPYIESDLLSLPRSILSIQSRVSEAFYSSQSFSNEDAEKSTWDLLHVKKVSAMAILYSVNSPTSAHGQALIFSSKASSLLTVTSPPSPVGPHLESQFV